MIVFAHPRRPVTHLDHCYPAYLLPAEYTQAVCAEQGTEHLARAVDDTLGATLRCCRHDLLAAPAPAGDNTVRPYVTTMPRRGVAAVRPAPPRRPRPARLAP